MAVQAEVVYVNIYVLENLTQVNLYACKNIKYTFSVVFFKYQGMRYKEAPNTLMNFRARF